MARGGAVGRRRPVRRRGRAQGVGPEGVRPDDHGLSSGAGGDRAGDGGAAPVVGDHGGGAGAGGRLAEGRDRGADRTFGGVLRRGDDHAGPGAFADVRLLWGAERPRGADVGADGVGTGDIVRGSVAGGDKKRNSPPRHPPRQIALCLGGG